MSGTTSWSDLSAERLSFGYASPLAQPARMLSTAAYREVGGMPKPAAIVDVQVANMPSELRGHLVTLCTACTIKTTNRFISATISTDTGGTTADVISGPTLVGLRMLKPISQAVFIADRVHLDKQSPLPPVIILTATTLKEK